MAKKNSVTLCMIAKNESHTIKRTLDSLDKFVDEWIIGIDDSVSDGTDRLVKCWFKKRKKKGEVYYFKWEDDFSKARNIGLDKATSDFIIIIDAHEYFEDVENYKLNQIFDKLLSNINFIYINLFNRETGTVIAQLRMFRNGKIRYEGRVHNKPVGYNLEESTLLKGITLIHDRYKPDIAGRAVQREEMILKHMEDAFQKNPNDLRALFYLSRQYIIKQDFRKSIEYGERYVSLIADPLAKAVSLANLAVCYLSLKDVDRGKKCIDDAILSDSTYPYPYILLAFYFGERSMYKEAEECILHAMKLNSMPASFLPLPISFYTWFPYMVMGTLKCNQGQYDEAIFFLNQAKSYEKFFVGKEMLKIKEVEDMVEKKRNCTGFFIDNFRINKFTVV